ncbi:MAG: GntR family transcriptional regulator [Sphingomonadales bacterium]|nr:GntR family transcriptional regulator [Sphingomonadales bacterium]
MPNTAAPTRDPADRDRYDSAADYAYAKLHTAIVEGHFSPGRRMREIELASWLGISRTPTRHALSRLEIEGLLEVRPRTGLVVSSLDETAMEELYDMRAVLEGAAAAMAAHHASPREVAALEQLIKDEARLPIDPAVRYRHNLVFHRAIYAAAHNRFLMKSLHALHDAIALLGPTTLGAKGRLPDAAREHRLIVEAITKRDGARAEEAARRHILKAVELRRTMLRGNVSQAGATGTSYNRIERE